MTLRYSRYTPGHGGAAQSRSLTVDDTGNATATSSFGRRAGRFSRALTAAERQEYEAAMATAARAPEPPAPSGPTPPSTTGEQITADGVPSVQFAPSGEPPEGFGGLVRVVRSLLDALTDSPVAALELDRRGPEVTLRHVGTEPIAVQAAGRLAVRALVYDADDLIVDDRGLDVDADVDGPAGPGWELRLADGLDLPHGYQTITVTGLHADIEGNAVPRAVELGWESG